MADAPGPAEQDALPATGGTRQLAFNNANDYVVALHDFSSSQSSSTANASGACLHLRKGQTVHVCSKDPSGWWWGQLEHSDATGWFPSNYVAPCEPPSPSPSAIHPQQQQQQQPSSPRSSITQGALMQRSQSEGQSFDASTSSSSDQALPTVLHAIRFVQQAAEARRSAHYQPSVAVVISGIRSLLSNCDCLAKESATLRQHPPLVQLRRSILAHLASLVQQARKCAAVADDLVASDKEVVQLIQLSDSLLQNAHDFVDYIDAHNIASTSFHHSPLNKSVPASLSQPALGRHRTKSMVDLRSRRKLAEHAEQLQRAQVGSTAMSRLASNASTTTSESSIWPAPSLSSAASSSADSLDGPRTPRDLRTQATALDVQHDQLLSVIAAFIGHAHAHTRASHPSSYAHLIDLTCEAVNLVKDVMHVAEEVERAGVEAGSSTADRTDLVAARDALYDATNELVRAVSIATNEPEPEVDESEEEEKQRLLRCATRLLRCASDSVGQVKHSLRSDAASRVFDMVAAAPQTKSPSRPAPKYSFESFVDHYEPTSFLRERHTLSMLGRTADSLDHLKHRYERRDSFSSSMSSSRSPHSSRDSTGSSHSASVPVVDLPSFTPATIRPLNPISSRRGQTAPAPLHLPIEEEGRFEDPASPKPASSSTQQFESKPLPSTTTTSTTTAATGSEKSLPTSPLRSPSQSSARSSRRHSRDAPLPKPEADALNRGYEAKEVVFNSDGQVTGGTLRCLVERMSLHDAPIDSSFSQTFFLTFRLFATPSELVNALVSRFDLAPPVDLPHGSDNFKAWVKAVAVPVRLRVVNILKTWFEAHWQPDSDSVVLVPVLSFAQNKVTPTLGQAGVRLTELVQKRSVRPQALEKVRTLHKAASTDRMRQGKPALDGVPLHLDSPSSSTFPPSAFRSLPAPPPVISKSSLNTLKALPFTKISITEFDPLEMARQFTLMESNLFCMIQPQDLFLQARGKAPHRGHVSVIKQMSALSTNITGWIAEVILNEQDAKRRTSVLKWFLKLADRCHSLQNYNTLMAVLAALHSSTIARLTKTWEGLPTKYKFLLEKLRKATEHTRNYAEYRAALRRASPPALPFLGLYLTDLTFCHDGNPSTRASQLDPELKLINFDRYRKMSKIVADLQRFQSPYNFVPVPELQTYLEQSLKSMDALGGNDVDRLYRRSLILEPRTTDLGGPPTPGLGQRPTPLSHLVASTPLSPVAERRFEGGNSSSSTASLFSKSRTRTAAV